MINLQVFWLLMIITFLSSVGRTFDTRASKLGTLSNDAIVLIGYMLITLVLLIFVVFTKGSETLKEIVNYRGPEWKMLLTSAALLAPGGLLYYWFYKKEKAHIISLYSIGFSIVFSLIANALILKENVKPQTWIGAAIMFVGLAFINYYHERK